MRRQKPPPTRALGVFLAALGLAAINHAPFSLAQAPIRRSFAKPIAFERSEGGLRDYNIKLGPVLFKFTASLRTEYNDNVGLSTSSAGSAVSDFIINPSFSISASWQVTKLNTLQFSSSIGYSKYLNNSQFDSQNLTIAPDSRITFDLYTGDFRIRFFDSFSIQDDPIGEGSLNNVGRFTRLTNSIGVSVLWDLNQLLLGLGYQHTNIAALGAVSSGGQGNSTAPSSVLDTVNRESDTAQFTVLVPVLSTTTVGMDIAGDITRYPDNPANDSAAARIAPFIETQVTRYTKVRASVGYQLDSILNGGPVTQLVLAPGVILTTTTDVPKSTNGSLYYNVSVIHQLNRYYSDTLSFGQQTQNNILGQNTQVQSVNYSSAWQISPLISLRTSFSLQDVSQNAAGFGQAVNYKYFSGSLSTGYRLTKNLSASVGYQFVRKFPNALDAGYNQNRVSLVFAYDF
jgi:hypothetical protein